MNARQVLVLQALSFLAYTIGSNYHGKNEPTTLPEPQQLAAWAILTFILLVGTDLDVTADLATAFAWLIFVTTMLLYGVPLSEKLSAMVKG